MLGRDAGQLGDLFGDGRDGSEFFVRPNVHGLTRHPDGAGAIGEGVAGHLGEDVGHRVAQPVDKGAELALERRDGDGFGELIKGSEVFHRVVSLSNESLDTRQLNYIRCPQPARKIMNDTHEEGLQGPNPLPAPIPNRPAEDFAQTLMVLLRDKEIPADKLAVMLQMRREVLADQAREAFQAHYAEFSADMPQVERDGTVALVKDGVEKGRYPFTTIEAMDAVIRPLLAKHGFAISFTSRDDKDGVTITGTLSGWGWERSSTYTLPADQGPGRNAIQARGSSRRYAKRYITDDLCNVVRKGKDDDAKGALEALIDAAQTAELIELIKATKTDELAFVKLMVNGAERLEDVRQRDFNRLLLALKDKARRVKK
jgi:hypothetical protein